MTALEFNKVVEDQLERIKNVLTRKATEYNLDETDRFSDFKRAAILTGQTPEQVLYSYMLKHILSITDMVQSTDVFDKARWEEKIGDIQVYLILLRGLLEDTGRMI